MNNCYGSYTPTYQHDKPIMVWLFPQTINELVVQFFSNQFNVLVDFFIRVNQPRNF